MKIFDEKRRIHREKKRMYVYNMENEKMETIARQAWTFNYGMERREGKNVAVGVNNMAQ